LTFGPGSLRQGISLPIVVVALAKGPQMIRAMRSVDSVSIEPGPPAELVLRHWSGRTSTHHLIEVSRLRSVRIGRRSADNPRGGDIFLEIRIGTSTYRTRPVPFDCPDGADGDVRLLEDALHQACPHAAIAALVNRTTWESDSAT
jgi:hypothetical protein